ncbi:hypothetical protein M8J76_003192 [Diaphorina citri]|nr:hypothetical protein M8J76_003192 [Diaphorina citri]KAI5743599.1 hypothetical protein M8J77_020047 [Diaphorina citri]
MCSPKTDWSSVNFDSISKTYRLAFGEAPALSSSVVDNVRQELSDNYRCLRAVQPLYPLSEDKLTSEVIRKAKSFLNSPNYEGAMRYLEDDYCDFNDTQGAHWNVPYSPYLCHQVPGALPPPLASPHLFPTEIEFAEDGVRMKVSTSGFARRACGVNDMTDIQIEGSQNMIRLSAMVEQVQLDCSQQNYVGRRITRTYHLPNPIVNEQMSCHYYSDMCVLVIQAPWLL